MSWLPVLMLVVTFALTFAGAGLALGPVGLLSVQPARAAQPSTVSIVVMITASGFNDGTLNITVHQGDTVQITFALDSSQINDTSPDNHHVIGVSGYDAQTSEIDPAHPNATMTFVADKTGSFTIYCLTPACPIHFLMVGGILTVEQPASTVTTSTSSTGTATSSASASTSTSSASSTTSSSSHSSTTSVSSTSSTQSSSTSKAGSGADDLASAHQLSGLLEWGVLVASVGFLAGAVVANRFVLPPRP